MLKRALLCLSLAAASPVLAVNWPEHPTLRAVRATAPVSIDGDLSDAAWQSAPEFTDFTQHDPDDGQPPTMRTSIRILYDEDQIVTAFVGGEQAGRARIAPPGTAELRVRTVPEGGTCRVVFRVARTKVPGGGDDRELGAHFDTFFHTR